MGIRVEIVLNPTAGGSTKDGFRKTKHSHQLALIFFPAELRVTRRVVFAGFRTLPLFFRGRPSPRFFGAAFSAASASAFGGRLWPCFCSGESSSVSRDGMALRSLRLRSRVSCALACLAHFEFSLRMNHSGILVSKSIRKSKWSSKSRGLFPSSASAPSDSLDSERSDVPSVDFPVWGV